MSLVGDDFKFSQTPEEFALQKSIVNEETIKEAKLQLGKCYEEIIETLRYYIDMPEDKYKFLAVWIIGTYFHKDFVTYPLLYFNAMKGSAKTRTSKLVNFLSFKGKGLVTNNTTEAVLFRHPKHVIMSLDEIERIGTKEMGAIRELLNAVYKRGTKIERSKKIKTKEGEQFVVEAFEPFFPLTIANIYGLESVLQDRAFTIILERSNNPLYTAIIENWDEREEIKTLKFVLSQISDVSGVTLRKKNYICHWNDFIKTSLHTHTLLTTLTSLTTQQEEKQRETLEMDDLFTKLYGSGITGRNLELAFPLLMTARHISEECFDDILKIIREMVNVKKDADYLENTDVSLIDFIAQLKKGVFDFVSIKDLTQEFRYYIDSSEEWLNERWMGKALVRLNLITENKKTNRGNKVRLNIAKAKEKLMMFQTEEKKDG